MKKSLFAAGAFAALMAFSAAPASAETIEVGGNVPDQCAITPGTSAVNFGTLANNGAAATQTNNYDIYCNTQFSLAVSSLYGRLQNTSVTSGTIGDDLLGDNSYNGSSEFFAALDYDVDGVSTTTLEPGVFTPAFGPLDPVADSLSINFNTEPLASGFLTGGTYADTFTISLTPMGL